MITSRKPNRSWPFEMNKIWPKPKWVNEGVRWETVISAPSIFICPSQRLSSQ
jgi:hypothetical protein